ncbi:MAG: hypothetical protein COV99_05125 [Bacteroidetes bacterium CG12_big_fil_rev_8_21_14_0_65_60_17]|nr:MAG: hypothetical protein COV99_05125 [Bacteroidetes bacterium CG12_big_fil_rev_8_21_14_0_65_60_17]
MKFTPRATEAILMTSVLLGLLLATSSSPLLAQLGPQFGAAVATDGEHVYVGEGRNLMQPGTLFIFGKGEDGWSEVDRLSIAEPDGEKDGFGRAVSLDGDWLAVGAPLQGSVYLYRRQADNSWLESMRLMHDAPEFGLHVLLRSGHLAVTSSGGGDTPPEVHMYRMEGSDWMPHGTLVVEGRDGNDAFGSALALLGRHIYVGAPRADQGRGRVHDFRWTGNRWTHHATLEADAPDDGDAFGSALTASEDHVFIGVPGRFERRGAVLRAAIAEEGLALESGLMPALSTGNDQFGASLAMSGNTLFVGAPGYDQAGGAVFRYTWDDDGEPRIDLLAPEFRQFRSGFGGSVAARDGMAIAGAAGHDNFEGAAFPITADRTDAWHVEDALYSDSGVFESITGGTVPCERDRADQFPCTDVNMVSFLSRSDVGAKRGIQMSDVWGWTDPETDREYALIGRTDGLSIVDLTDAEHPVFVGDLPKTATANQSLWRDVKTYKNYAYVVADGAGAHHVQIFDLTRIRDVDPADMPVTFTEDNIYKGVYSSHNIVINEETGFAYAVGSDSGGEACGGALHMMDLSDPLNPTFAGCFNDPSTGRGGSGATHDAQCVLYRGPDSDYTGREICLSSNGTALSIADVTDKDNPVAISVADYPAVAYAHQGWLTEDQRYFYLNDEGDEARNLVDGTRTLIFDLSDLDEPVVSGEYIAPDNAIDHNLYVRDNIMYQTNYVSGLRLLDVSDPENPVEVGWFDTVPYGPNDNSPVLGAWSNYPYFKSGVIVVTSGREGVFFLKRKQVDS